jgi:hypothetical protein
LKLDEPFFSYLLEFCGEEGIAEFSFCNNTNKESKQYIKIRAVSQSEKSFVKLIQRVAT